jgi:hypothetical protein
MAGAEVLMSYPDGMDDYDLPELTGQQVHERVEDWRRRLDKLFARIRTRAAVLLSAPPVKIRANTFKRCACDESA